MPELLLILLVLMIVAALVAVESDSMLASIVSVGAVGFLLSIAFLFLGAPDIAITQLAVEVLCLVILIRATAGRAGDEKMPQPRILSAAVAVVAVLLLAALGIRMLAEFPAFGEPVMARFDDTPSAVYLETGLAGTGAANLVTAVLLDFRAYDTLGEATVLFCAVLGAVTLLRRKAREHPGGAGDGPGRASPAEAEARLSRKPEERG